MSRNSTHERIWIFKQKLADRNTRAQTHKYQEFDFPEQMFSCVCNFTLRSSIFLSHSPNVFIMRFMKRADLRDLHSTVFTFIHIWIQNGWRDLTVFKDTVMYYGNCSSAHWHIVTSNFASVLVWSLADSAVSGPLLYWLSCTMLFVIYKGDEEEEGDKPCKPAHTHVHTRTLAISPSHYFLTLSV